MTTNRYSLLTTNSYILVIILLLTSCKSIINTVDEFPKNFSGELQTHAGKIGENAGSGLIRGISSEESLDNTEKLLDELVLQLNHSLQEIDLNNVQIESIINNLVMGITDALDQNSVQLSTAVNDILDQIYLDQLLVELASEENKHALASLVGHTFSKESGNGRELGNMLNQAISELDISPLAEQLNEIKLDKMLSETAYSISEASEAITAVSERFRIGQQKFYWDVLIVSLAVVLGGLLLGFIRNYFESRRYFINRKKEDIRKRMKTLNAQNREELIRELQSDLRWIA